MCIHSVVVDKDYRRQGVALALLKEYLTRLTNTEGSPYKRVLLITHEELRELYEKAGFTWIGPSDVVHGGRPWFEMRVELATPGQPRISSDALQALLRPSKEKLEPNFISDYHHGVDDLIVQDDDAQGISLNKYDLLCPRGCRSVILKAKAAQWTERTSVAMEPSDFKHALLPPLPPPPETAQWWLVKPSPMAFENIGFSRPAGTLSTGMLRITINVQFLTQGTGKRLKLLTCAECDLGPLGWCEEGGSEFWLATSRVGYRKVRRPLCICKFQAPQQYSGSQV